ncbi:DNA/RNA polymerase [Trichoderma longibrachiatum]|uniref:DNA polymerase eta n=1 Tax=Trichoderma longibrachiatum ATCC 18648 TaxID=983965 RepID=A0A2T4CET6_TRILO|nr:DNA/RNA polymerase [Trichoderma longibrachiatum ATCC 18648]
MSSPCPNSGASSPLRDARRSRFTYRQLAQLATYGTTTPLRVIAHIDLDAFYAQCEMVRLGVPEDKPLAVQQWQGLIAINYPARKWNIGRHCDVAEAKKLCPELIAQHVATWREGDDKWAYRDDAAANIATDKVSLDPYRLQSRRILTLIKDCLPKDLRKVEKASIDEVFLDLSAQVHAELLRRFPELSTPPPSGDVAENLPFPSAAALDWRDDNLVVLEEEQEALDPDWDDVVMLVGSEIVRGVRAEIRERLGYTCSAGIANSKLVSKLGSAFKKPNAQTVVRSRAVLPFLAAVKVTKMRNLGGKLGDQVVSTFSTESVNELRDIPLDQFKAKLGDETGVWLYNTIRGVDHSEVNSRTQIKSMLSAKSFRPSITTPEQAVKWLRIFAGDIYSRLVEEGILEHKRWPRTINLHHRHAGQTRSKQSPIAPGKPLDEQALFNLAKELLHQIMAEGDVWPCANLSLSVGGFEEGIKGNMAIGAFFKKRDEASRPLRPCETATETRTVEQSSKRPRTDEVSGIHRFFAKQPDGDAGFRSASGQLHGKQPPVDDISSPWLDQGGDEADTRGRASRFSHDTVYPEDTAHPVTYACTRCKACFDDEVSLQSHQDWHFAKDIEDSERATSTPSQQPAPSRGQASRRSGPVSRRGRGGSKLEQGQSRLKFG